MTYDFSELRAKTLLPDGKRFVERCLAEYRKNYEGKPIVALNYSHHKLIYKTGDRDAYQRGFLDRRYRYALLQILAIADDRWLDDLEDILAAICDEYTWIWPAHSLIDKAGKFDYTVVDLYNAQTAFYLSETYRIFGEKLSLDLRDRIKSAVWEKVLCHFESRTFGYEKSPCDNWATVCGGVVGMAYLHLFPERFPLVKARLFDFCKFYLDGIGDDGFCTEGPSYFAYGFGFMAAFLELYREQTGDTPDFAKTDKIARALDYGMHNILDGRYIQISDQGQDLFHGFTMYELLIHEYYPQYLLPDYDFVGKADLDYKPFIVRMLDSVGRYDNEPRRPTSCENYQTFYENAGVYLLSRPRYSFTVKGGHNDEMHNHNDVGAFSLLHGGRRLIADLGAGHYTQQYFVPKFRYSDETFVTISEGHSVPIVDGKGQGTGKEYYGTVLSHSETGVKYELATAYGLEADESLTAEYLCEEDGVRVRYAFSGKERQLSFRFVSDDAFTYDGKEVSHEGLKVSGGEGAEISVFSHGYMASDTFAHTAYGVDYAYPKAKKITAEFFFRPTEE